MKEGDARIQFPQRAELIPKQESLRKCSAVNASAAIIKMPLAVVVVVLGGCAHPHFMPEYHLDMCQYLIECVFL